MRRFLFPALLAFLLGCSSSSADVDPVDMETITLEKAAAGSGGGIQYRGGSVMLGTPTAYLIWYGDWSNNTATTIIPDFITNLSGSPYYRINTTYYDGEGHVSGNIQLGRSILDNYSHGSSLSNSDVQSVVANALSSLPTDPNGIYLVLTSKDVNESGFCSSFCGWHTHAVINGTDVKYAFIGNPDRCPSSCEAQTISPNGNAGADGMASIIAHETEETITDPDLNAWLTRRGQENADLCAWKFGTTYTMANGSKANMKLGMRDYLIQENWLNVGAGQCALSY